jgi:hypothetical protein
MTEVFIFETWDNIRDQLARAWRDTGLDFAGFSAFEAMVRQSMISLGYLDADGEATYRRVQLQEVLAKHFPYDKPTLERFIAAVWKHAFPRSQG